MTRVRIVPIGTVDPPILGAVAAAVSTAFSATCELVPSRLAPTAAFHPERQQTHSTELLMLLQASHPSTDGLLLGVTAADLYIPILTHVFGEAELGGRAAVVGFHRLRQEFYGLPPDLPLLARRTAVECVHELGHTRGLTHCDDYSCVMAASHSVEKIDLKGERFCAACRARLIVS